MWCELGSSTVSLRHTYANFSTVLVMVLVTSVGYGLEIVTTGNASNTFKKHVKCWRVIAGNDEWNFRIRAATLQYAAAV